LDLDRQTIEKRDFPFARRGYDTEAVDAHLAQLAGDVEALKRNAAQAQAQAQSKRGTESLASAAATQVQAIVEAAETTASDIRRQADLDAKRVNQEADRDAQKTRDDAVSRAQSHVEEVSKATALMLQRVTAMETEVTALIESLRTGSNRLTADLALLEGNMGDLYDAAGRNKGAAAS
jgi:DivIVA domain-containing protein